LAVYFCGGDVLFGDGAHRIGLAIKFTERAVLGVDSAKRFPLAWTDAPAKLQPVIDDALSHDADFVLSPVRQQDASTGRLRSLAGSLDYWHRAPFKGAGPVLGVAPLPELL
jgi:hypothetical protein